MQLDYIISNPSFDIDRKREAIDTAKTRLDSGGQP